jgi:hypothetical protein
MWREEDCLFLSGNQPKFRCSPAGNPSPPVLIGLICVEVIVSFQAYISLGYEKGRVVSEVGAGRGGGRKCRGCGLCIAPVRTIVICYLPYLQAFFEFRVTWCSCGVSKITVVWTETVYFGTHLPKYTASHPRRLVVKKGKPIHLSL